MDYVTYTVRPQNTLFGIAQFFGTTALDIARYNGIVYPYTIYPGQKLRIPVEEITPPQYYFVRPGESVWLIASRYGLNANDIITLNGLENANTIYPGQRLKLF